VTPSLLSDGMWAVAEERNGYAGEWSVTAFAICARPAGVVRHVEVVSGATAPSPVRFQHTAARCPGDKRAIGSGAAVQSACCAPP